MYREKYFPDSVDEVGEGHELAAEELRLAARSPGHLTNHIDVEELLDVVFEDFLSWKMRSAEKGAVSKRGDTTTNTTYLTKAAVHRN